MIVGVVDQDVEHHATEQLAHIAHVCVAIHDTSAPQELRELRIAIAFRCCPQSDVCGQAVHASASFAIETPDRDGMTAGEPYCLRACGVDSGFARERHR